MHTLNKTYCCYTRGIIYFTKLQFGKVRRFVHKSFDEFDIQPMAVIPDHVFFIASLSLTLRMIAKVKCKWDFT